MNQLPKNLKTFFPFLLLIAMLAGCGVVSQSEEQDFTEVGVSWYTVQDETIIPVAANRQRFYENPNCMAYTGRQAPATLELWEGEDSLDLSAKFRAWDYPDSIPLCDTQPFYGNLFGYLGHGSQQYDVLRLLASDSEDGITSYRFSSQNLLQEVSPAPDPEQDPFAVTMGFKFAYHRETFSKAAIKLRSNQPIWIYLDYQLVFEQLEDDVFYLTDLLAGSEHTLSLDDIHTSLFSSDWEEGSHHTIHIFTAGLGADEFDVSLTLQEINSVP